MNKKKTFIALVAAGGLTLAGSTVASYAQTQTASGQTGQTTATPSGGAALSAADKKFVMDAAIGGMAEVEAGRLASQKGATDGVKQFGQQMVDEHTKANDELKQIASGKGAMPPADLDAKHKAMQAKLDKLSGAAFDSEYVKGQIKGHEEMLAVLDREIKSGSDAELKAYAEKMKPAVQEHLTKARSMSGSKMNGGAMGASPTGSQR